MGCPADSSCIALSMDDQGSLIPEWVFAPDSNVFCGPAGLVSRKLLAGLGCDVVGDDTIFPLFGSTVSQFSPVLTIANPSGSRPALAHVAVLFGTIQIDAQNGADITVNDLVGIAPTGTLSLPSYAVVNTAEVSDHPVFPAGINVAFNNQPSNQWSCPFPVAPGAAIDMQFERRVSMGGAVGGFGSVLLRTTFIFLWMVVT